jgi:hypothetical protein
MANLKPCLKLRLDMNENLEFRKQLTSPSLLLPAKLYHWSNGFERIMIHALHHVSG